MPYATQHAGNSQSMKSTIVTVVAGQLIVILGWAVLVAVAWGKLSEQFKSSAEWRAAATPVIEAVKYGRYEERLRYLEENSKKIDTMVAQMNRMEEALKKLENEKK